MGKTLVYGEITVANMTEPFTVMLTNEAQQFATDSNRKVTSAQSYYTDIIVIRGSQERTDYTIGNITSGSGITVSKSSKRVTFNVSAGTTIGADTGIIEIPITLDGQTVKKQFSWSCGKQGPQGVKGQDGTSVKITSKSVTYQTSTSGTTAPTGTWSTTVPTVANGQYLWTKTTVQYSDGNKTEAYSVSYKGTNGTNGTSVTVSKTEVTYQVSTSGTTAPTGTWSTTMPSCDQGQYLWTKTYVKYSDGKETTSYSVSYKGVDGEKFSWNALIGSSFLYNSLPNNVNFSMVTVNNVSATAFTTNGLHYKATASNGAPNSSRGVKINSSVLDLKVGDTVTFSCDVKGTFGTKNNGLCLMHATTTDNNSWAAVHNGLKYSTSIPDWTRKSTTHTIPSNIKIESDGSFYLYFYFGGGTGSEVDVYVRNIQLEKGSAASPWAPHPKDLEGRGVSQTVQYYLATSQASGVTFSTSGWSTDITTQKLTADKKYLWNCYQTKYSDGTSEPISTPKVIGVYGDKGQKGDNAKNLTITPSSQYFKSTDGGKTFAPNTITIKPTIQGEISFAKWQYSIDGGVSFADVVSGQTGLTINNNVLTVNKDSSLYSDAVTMVTFRAVANDSSFYDTCSIAKIYDVNDIGDGRNLLWNSNFAKTDEAITGTTNSWGLHYRNSNLIPTIDTSTKHNGFNTLKTVSAANGDKNSSNDLEWFAWGISEKTSNNLHTLATNYTLSFYAKASVSTDFVVRWGYDAYDADTTRTLTTDWQKYEIKLHQTTSTYSISIIFKLLTAGTVWFSEFKLEKGSSATGYSPAPEDVQTAILSTKSEISDVSLKVDKNKQAIEQRVEKTTYQQDLNLVKGDISKANEGLNKWRYEIYPKSLFASEYQGKSTMDVFAKNTNLTPSQSVLINDTDFGKSWAYGDNYIGYALTFVKFSAAKSIAITFKHDDGAHLYLNGKLIGGDDTCNTGSGESLTLSFIQGWNCLEVVLNEKSGGEYIGLGTTISAISECQLMNCYYGTPVARQSHITNQLVENTTNIDGVNGSVQKVMSTVGGSSKIDEFVNNYSTWKKKVDGIETRVGKTYVTKNDFDGLEIGGVNLFVKSTASRGWWISDTGVLNANGGWGYSDYINVSGMKNYIASGFTNLGISPATCFYDSNKTFISGVQSTNQNSQDSKRKTLPIPSNAKYMRFSFMLVDIDTLKIEQGTKATAYSPAPEDDEINGQNLVSNLPSNWEQGTVTEGSTTGTTYANTKSSSAGSVRPKELIPVSGNITISTAYSNQSKKPIRHWIAAYDVNKNYLGNNYVSNAWNSFPRTLNMKDAKYIAIMVGYTDSSAITPSDISQICLKIERGTSATPFTLAPEDVNGKIVNVETIANQTANKFSWIVKSGTSASNFEITDKFMNLVSTNINLDGIVSFMNTAKGDGRKNLYNLDYSSFENVASQKDAICYAKDNGVTSVSIDSSVSYDGNKSLKISYTTANLNSSTTPLYLGSSANNYGCVKIQAGKQYLLSCYVKSDSATGLFMIDIQGHDTPDTKTDGLYLSNIDPRKLPGSSTGVNLSTDWQRAVCAIKVANNATGLYWSVVPLIWGRPSSSSAPKTFNVWVDCIMLEEVDSISNEPGTYIFDKETIIDGGSIKTDTITGNQILAGSITADKIDVNSIFAQDITATGTITGANLIGATGTFSGQITATQGSIAGWTIIKDKMYTTGSGKYTGIGKYGSAYAFWAGATSNDNGNSAVFKVGHTGKLTATDADITGTITATNGKIGRYDITSTYLMTNSGSNASGIGGNQAFWAGAEDSNSAPFRVGYDGVLWAENAAIRGSIETGNLGDEGDTVSIINGHIGIQGTSNNVEIYSTGFKFGIDGDYYLMSVSEGVKCYRNLYATDFVADGWLYCSEVHSSGAVVIGADSESFYWAHGYQIARGTSWGGVCVGDDSQQLRLYGSSIWASHSISTSDENLKENFTTLDQYENFYMNLNPIGFNYIGDYDGKKTHFGFGAHKTEDVLESEGYDADKFAVVTHRPLVQEDIEKRFGKDVEVDIETEYGVSYTEFIALNTHMIQKTRRELTKVKQEKADLEVRLQAIEAKLGL